MCTWNIQTQRWESCATMGLPDHQVHFKDSRWGRRYRQKDVVLMNPDDPREPSDEELGLLGTYGSLDLDADWQKTPMLQSDSPFARMWRDRDSWRKAQQTAQRYGEEWEAKTHELEERNANQVQKIGTLRAQLEAAQMHVPHNPETGVPIDTRTYADKPDPELVDRVRNKTDEEVAQELERFEAMVAELTLRADEKDVKIESQARTIAHLESRTVDVPEAREPKAETPPLNELGQWWMDLAADEYGKIAAKITEYGGEGRAYDLIDLGQALVDSGVKIPDGEFEGVDQTSLLQELGCFMYLVGKFGRWKAAVSEGRLVSEDTLSDLGVYVRMVQRVRQHGGWPS